MKDLQELLNPFPKVQLAFAYGSGIFKQPGLYKAKQPSATSPMLDFIFAVEDPTVWHAENLEANPSHYSFLATLGPSLLTAVAEKLGAGVYFNTMVPIGQRLVKYGVVRTEAVRQDLLNWTSLYIAGRLQKPVQLLHLDPTLDAAQQVNLEAALRCALLLLPPTFSTNDLLRTICSLSYTGDVRVGLAEDANKVQRIAEGSAEGLQQMYAAPLSKAVTDWGVLTRRGPEGSLWAQDDRPEGLALLASTLPSTLTHNLAAALPGLPALEQPGDKELGSALGRALAMHPERQLLLSQALAVIVARSSRRQAVAGLLTAGPWKSVQYVYAKLQKAWLK